MVRVRLFAAPRDAVGSGEVDVPLPEEATAADLLDAAVARYPALAPWRDHLRVAVNRRAVGPDAAVGDGDEVALLPPVSGGDGTVDVAFTDDLAADPHVAAARGTGSGAVVTFHGLVRPDDGTEALDFEAYEAMALPEMQAIAHAARGKWGLARVVVRHRLGTVPVGEATVLVVVAAAHRREAFEAAAWVMDEVKTRVPVWKREVGPDRWVHPGVDQ